MNNGSLWRGILIALLVVSAAAAIGVGAYNAGVAQGITESGRVLAAPPSAAVPYAGVPYHYYGWHRPWGVGFFPIFPFFSILFVFLILRAFWWGGPWHRDGWRYGHGYGPARDQRSDEAHPRS